MASRRTRINRAVRELRALLSSSPHVLQAATIGDDVAAAEVVTTVIDAAGTLGEVMGAKEFAAELGVTVQNLRKVANLPEPVAEVSATPLWDADAARAFARERRRNRPSRWKNDKKRRG